MILKHPYGLMCLDKIHSSASMPGVLVILDKFSILHLFSHFFLKFIKFNTFFFTYVRSNGTPTLEWIQNITTNTFYLFRAKIHHCFNSFRLFFAVFFFEIFRKTLQNFWYQDENFSKSRLKLTGNAFFLCLISVLLCT